MDRRVDVAEGPFIGGQLAIRVHIPLAGEKQKLAFGEFRIHQGHWNTMESQVPGGVPRVFPFIRHREDVCIVQMSPFAITAPFAFRRRWKLTGIPVEPFGYIVIKELFAPDHTRQGLALDISGISVCDVFLELSIRLVRLTPTGSKDCIEIGRGAFLWTVPARFLCTAGNAPGFSRTQSQTHRRRPAWTNGQAVESACFRASSARVYRSLFSANDVVVESILEITLGSLLPIKAADIGLVIAEEKVLRFFALKSKLAHVRMLDRNDTVLHGPQFGFLGIWFPRPGVPEPELREHRDGGLFRATVMHRDHHQEVLWSGFSIFDEHIKIPVIIENARIEQLKLWLVFAAPAILLDQTAIGEFPLRIFVEHLQVGVRRRRIQVVIEFLHVLPMIALAVGQAKEPLFENRVTAIPQRQSQADSLLVIADACDAVLAPTVGSAASMVVRQIFPRVAMWTVVLAYRSPLALREIRSPTTPIEGPIVGFSEASAFSGI
jgi:hypothetical protein